MSTCIICLTRKVLLKIPFFFTIVKNNRYESKQYEKFNKPVGFVFPKRVSFTS